VEIGELHQAGIVALLGAIVLIKAIGRDHPTCERIGQVAELRVGDGAVVVDDQAGNAEQPADLGQRYSLADQRQWPMPQGKAREAPIVNRKLKQLARKGLLCRR